MSPLGASTLWTGWDPLPASTASTPTELLSGADGEGGILFELLAIAGRGFRPPRYLTVVGGPSGDAARDNPAPASRGYREAWSIEYRRIAETAPVGTAPYAIYLLGVDPPEGITDAELETFNDFYTNVHLPEVAERRNAARAERFERSRVLRPPVKGAPRFLASYEVDEAGASNRRHIGPPYSSGPDVWQRHTTPWRLWFRRVTE